MNIESMCPEKPIGFSILIQYKRNVCTPKARFFLFSLCATVGGSLTTQRDIEHVFIPSLAVATAEHFSVTMKHCRLASKRKMLQPVLSYAVVAYSVKTRACE